MDANRFAALTKTLTAHVGSRRKALLGGATAALGGTLAAVVPHREAEAALAATFRCPKGVLVDKVPGSEVRFAQTFTATRAGELREVRIAIIKPAGTAGNYVVQLVPTFGGIPADEARSVFAAGMVPDAAVPAGRSTLVVKMGGTRLTKGGKYAVLVMRLGTAVIEIPVSEESTCANSELYAAADGAPFSRLRGDMIVSVLVA